MARSYMPAPQVQTIVIDLGNSCQCFGHRQELSRVLNELEGVIEHCYNVERNEIRVTGTVDPGILIGRVKKHARVAACFPQPPQQPFPPSGYGNWPPQQPPQPQFPPPCCGQQPPPPQYPPPCYGQGQPPSGNNYAPALGPQHGPIQTHTNGPPPCCGQTPSEYPPALGPQHGPIHTPADQPPPRNCLHNSNCIYGPPPHLMKVPYCRDPPPSSACHCPPPPHHNHQPSHQNSVYHRNPPPNNSGADQLNNFLHGPTSPLIPGNVCSAGGILGQTKDSKMLYWSRKKGVKLRFEDGQVKSCHPTNYLECRPGYHSAAMPPSQQSLLPYVSSSSDENPNGSSRK